MENTKLVDYHKYCLRCKHRRVKETDEPCNECLTVSARENSHKPIGFVKGGRENVRKRPAGTGK